MTRAFHVLTAAAVLALGCATPVTVRTGGAGGRTVFRVHAEARAVLLSGTMTGWRPRPLEQRGKDFELTVDVPPGRHEYRLEVLDDTGDHVVFSRDAERTDDGFGGENAVLRVR